MPTLSIIRLGNKCACTYTGRANEMARMLTQCALRDELLAQAITQSALHLNQKNREENIPGPSANMPIEKEIFYFSLNEDSSSDNQTIQKP